MKFDNYIGRLFQASVTIPGFKPLEPSLSNSSLFSRVFGNSSPNISDFINAAFHTAIMIGAILAVIRIAYAGVLYMTTDIFDKKSRAKEVLRDSVLGLLLLLAIFLILNQINPDLVNLGKLDIDSSSAAR